VKVKRCITQSIVLEAWRAKVNSDEIVEMIDAIYEGKYYAHGFSTKKDVITIEVGAAEGTEEFWFSSFTPGANFLAKIDDPRTAREIAGALVAWANRKDGLNNGAHFLSRLGVSIIDDGRPEFPSVDDYMHINRGNDTRKNWYARNVGRMTQETKDRNLKDLLGILDSTPDIPKKLHVLTDLQAAIQILRNNGAKGPKQSDK
jgi:hypothetical protein